MGLGFCEEGRTPLRSFFRSTPRGFQTHSEQKIAELLTEKDSKNTQKATKGCRLLFDEYLKEKHIHSCPETANGLATVLKKSFKQK